MKLFPHLFLLFLLPSIAYSQAGEWTWMKGDSTPNNYGNFGIMGVPAPTNQPPSRYACGYWNDLQGNLWIYGGVGGIGDLWKFDPLTTEWTWMNGDSLVGDENIAAAKGIYNSLNTPGYIAYGMFTWVTLDNHLWLFGGSSYYSPNANLWQYNPDVNQWAWMGNFDPVNYGTMGIGNITTMPGARLEGNAAWTDNQGNLWLFGGNASFGDNNDVWKYDVTTGIWTWMSGSNNADDPGIYGTQGVASVNNYPSGRNTNVFWIDSMGKFWLAGGFQWATSAFVQDVWNFNPQTLAWTWVKGSQFPDSSAARGTLCNINISNSEGLRYENRAIWKICDEVILNFGGLSGLDGFGSKLYARNDLWAYSPSQNSFEKISDGPPGGYYGTLGISSPNNFPPPRSGAVGLKDKNNNIWMPSDPVSSIYHLIYSVFANNLAPSSKRL